MVVCLVTALLQIFHRMQQWKNFENWSIFGKDMDKTLWLTFLGHPVDNSESLIWWQARGEFGWRDKEADNSVAAGADVVASRGPNEHGLRSDALRWLLPAEHRHSARLELSAVRPTRQTDQRPHQQTHTGENNTTLRVCAWRFPVILLWCSCSVCPIVLLCCLVQRGNTS